MKEGMFTTGKTIWANLFYKGDLTVYLVFLKHNLNIMDAHVIRPLLSIYENHI